MVQLPRNEKQTYQLNSRAQRWQSGLTLAMTLTLKFQGKIQNLLYLSQKWSDCHETKSKHIDWTLGLIYDHGVWLWPWPWPCVFKVKYRICYISAKNGQIASKRKANIWIELQASNVTNGFELDHNLDLWILKVKCDLDLWPHRWPWPWIFMVKFWNGCIPPMPLTDTQRPTKRTDPHNMGVMKCNDSAQIRTGKGDVRKVVTGERWWVGVVLPRLGSPDWWKTPPSSIPTETCGPDSSCRSLLAENWASCIHVNVVMSAPCLLKDFKLFIL